MANNKYMNDLYKPDKVRIFLQYVDINNEYGWSMIKTLPTHGFKWKNGEGFNTEKIDGLVKKDEKDYVLEVDVEYPKELHKKRR